MLLLPLTALVLLWIAAAHHRRGLGFDRLSVRGALVLAYVTFELVLLLATELSSAGHSFTAGAMAVVWALIVLALLVVDAGPILGFLRTLAVPDGRGRIRRRFGRLGTEEFVWIAVVTAIMAILVAVGFLYLPNNADSMVYHLARVEHWIQNRTIAPFATHYTTQIEFSPLAEYNLAHIHLLSGTDRFDFMVQWVAAAVSVVGISELVRLLGGGRRVQVMASVVAATIPTGILLATSTENDYVAAAIGLGLLVLVASFRFERRWVVPALGIGVTAGLGYMTKGTTPTLIWPAAVGLLALSAYRTFRSQEVELVARQAITRGVTMLAALLVVCLPFLIQSEQLFGSTVGPAATRNIVSTYQPNAMAANVVRATALNFDVGNGVSGLDTYLARAVLSPLGHVFNVFGVSESDLRFALPGASSPFAVADYSASSRDENYAPSPWHTVLIVLALPVVIVAVWRGRRWMRPALVLALGLTVGYLLFNAIATWSVFTVRYNLQSFLPWSAVIAIALTVTHRWVQRLVLIGLVVACLPQLLNNVSRPLVPPTAATSSPLEGYFDYLPPVSTPNAKVNADSYQFVTREVAASGCNRAAFGNWVLYEYPIWVGLSQAGWHGTLDDVDVQNATAKVERRAPPCAVISQFAPGTVTPLGGTVNLSLPIDILSPQVLAVSLDASAAPRLREPTGFVSEVPGTKVLPGGGWSYFGSVPVAHARATLYVTSPSARTVRLALGPVGGTKTPPSISVGGRAVTVERQGAVFVAEVPVRAGVTEVDLGVNRSTTSSPPVLAVGQVRALPAF